MFLALRASRVGRGFWAILLVAGLVHVQAADGAVPRGALKALSGHGACLGVGRGCPRLRGPRGLARIAISPDGRTLYLAGQGGGIAIVARDRRSGRLRQLSGRAGCLRGDGAEGCARVVTLSSPTAIAVSLDGRSVYATTRHGVLGLARNLRTGAIRAMAGAGGCVDALRAGCGSLRGVADPNALYAPDARTLYVAGRAPGTSNGSPGGLAALARSPATGSIGQVPGPGGCLNDGARQGCASLPCLSTRTALAQSADGRYLYAGTTDSLDPESTSPGAVVTLVRAPATGALALLGCARRNEAVSDLLPLPAVGSVLVTTLFGDRGLGVVRAGVDLYRPGADGALRRERQLACADDPGGQHCPIPFSGTSTKLALSRLGDTVYVSFYFEGLAALRFGSGGLARLPGRWGCTVSRDHYKPPSQCTRAGAETGDDMLVSPDGRNLYVGTLGTALRGGNLYRGGVEVFRIQP